MNNTQDTFEQLRKSFDGSDPFMTQGHQIIKMRRGNRTTPEWVKNNKKIQELLLRSFPKMKTNKTQRMRAGRWARIIHLYFKMKMTYGQVAAELGVTPKRIADFILRIHRASKGRRTDNRGLLGVRKQGRPRKHTR